MFLDKVDNWLFVNNSSYTYEIIAEGTLNEATIHNITNWADKKTIMETKEQLKAERERIVKGLEETYRRLVEYKKQKKSPKIVVRNGEIVAVDPNEIQPTTSYKRNAG